MTVSTLPRRVSYFGNGVTKTFSVPYQFFEINVYVGGVLKSPGTDYAITQSRPGTEGTIAFGVAPALGASIVIVGATDKSQIVDLVDNDSAPAEVYEAALDRLSLITQDLAEGLGRMVRAPFFGEDIPELDFAANPNAVLATDSEGVPYLVSAEDPTSPLGQAVVQATAARDAAVTAKTAAQAAASDAGEDALDAANSASSAATSAINANASRVAAQAARDEAEAIAAGDLSASNIANDSDVLGASIADALDWLKNNGGQSTAAAISFTPAGNVSATDVQAAIVELDTEKAPTSHTHTAANITDFTEAAQDAIGALLTDSSELDFTYNDAGNAETLSLINNSIVAARLKATATDKLFGRSSAGAGAGEEIPCTSYARTILAAATAAAARSVLGGREVLTANRTYYVRTDGSDSNSGLVNAAGGAFLTIQKAENVARTLDFNGFGVTISIGDGTYTAGVGVGAKVGQAGPTSLVFTSTSGIAANVIVSVTSNNAFACGYSCQISNLTVTTSGTFGSAIVTTAAGTTVYYSGVIFGACVGPHLAAGSGGVLNAVGPTSITGGSAQGHWAVSNGGVLIDAGQTITITGTPAFSGGFAIAATAGSMQVNANTFTGSATGPRYSATSNGVIQTFGSGPSYLPGNSAGSTATGGQYI